MNLCYFWEVSDESVSPDELSESFYDELSSSSESVDLEVWLVDDYLYLNLLFLVKALPDPLDWRTSLAD